MKKYISCLTFVFVMAYSSILYASEFFNSPPLPYPYQLMEIAGQFGCIQYTGGDNLLLKPCNKGAAQTFYLESIYGKDSTYIIHNNVNGYCLDDMYHSDKVGVWRKCHGKSNQQWFIHSSTFGGFSGYRLISGEGNCLSEEVGSDQQLWAKPCDSKYHLNVWGLKPL